jgi:hypothetical protein
MANYYQKKKQGMTKKDKNPSLLTSLLTPNSSTYAKGVLVALGQLKPNAEGVGLGELLVAVTGLHAQWDNRNYYGWTIARRLEKELVKACWPVDNLLKLVQDSGDSHTRTAAYFALKGRIPHEKFLGLLGFTTGWGNPTGGIKKVEHTSCREEIALWECLASSKDIEDGELFMMFQMNVQWRADPGSRHILIGYRQAVIDIVMARLQKLDVKELLLYYCPKDDDRLLTRQTIELIKSRVAHASTTDLSDGIAECFRREKTDSESIELALKEIKIRKDCSLEMLVSLYGDMEKCKARSNVEDLVKDITKNAAVRVDIKLRIQLWLKLENRAESWNGLPDVLFPDGLSSLNLGEVTGLLESENNRDMIGLLGKSLLQCKSYSDEMLKKHLSQLQSGITYANNLDSCILKRLSSFSLDELEVILSELKSDDLQAGVVELMVKEIGDIKKLLSLRRGLSEKASTVLDIGIEKRLKKVPIHAVIDLRERDCTLSDMATRVLLSRKDTPVESICELWSCNQSEKITPEIEARLTPRLNELSAGRLAELYFSSEKDTWYRGFLSAVSKVFKEKVSQCETRSLLAMIPSAGKVDYAIHEAIFNALKEKGDLKTIDLISMLQEVLHDKSSSGTIMRLLEPRVEELKALAMPQ